MDPQFAGALGRDDAMHGDLRYGPQWLRDRIKDNYHEVARDIGEIMGDEDFDLFKKHSWRQMTPEDMDYFRPALTHLSEHFYTNFT